MKKKTNKKTYQEIDRWAKKPNRRQLFLNRLSKIKSKYFIIGIVVLLILSNFLFFILVKRGNYSYKRLWEKSYEETNNNIEDVKDSVVFDQLLFNVPFRFSVDDNKKFDWNVFIIESPDLKYYQYNGSISDDQENVLSEVDIYFYPKGTEFSLKSDEEIKNKNDWDIYIIGDGAKEIKESFKSQE